MAFKFAGAGGPVCAGISFPDEAHEQTAEIRRQGSAGVCKRSGGQGRSSLWGEGGEEHPFGADARRPRC